MSKNIKMLGERKERLERIRAEREKRRKRVVTAGIFAAIILVAGFAAYYLINGNKDAGGYSPATSVGGNASADKVTVPVSEVGTQAGFYSYDSGGTTVRFFLVRGSDGDLHAAADACDVCYPNHKGYRQSGDQMQCNNCGKVFAINHLGTKNTAGGCWPSFLPMKTDGGNVVVNKSDLDGKAYMFR